MPTMQEKQLGQLRPANTSAASIYAPPASTTGIVSRVEIQNVTASGVSFSIYHDDNGTTYDEESVIYLSSPILANGHVSIDAHWSASSTSSHLAVKTSTASALTFTFYGVEIA